MRRFNSQREENSRFSWLGRITAAYIAGGYMIGEGQENTALANSQTLALDDIERALLGADSPSSAPADGNSNGSYERFMTKFGSGGRSPFG